MALVMVTAPYPAGSSASISPPAAVFEIAPAKVLQGAVRLHGLASSPTPETQVLFACAWAGAAAKNGTKKPIAKISKAIRRIINLHVSTEILPALLKSRCSMGSHPGTAARSDVVLSEL